jgi:DNA-directed RNA polymerase subunit RPC12/RpoP
VNQNIVNVLNVRTVLKRMIVINYQCIDCNIILDNETSIENAAQCEGCNSIVCEECVYTDHEMYECSKCFNETDQEWSG